MDTVHDHIWDAVNAHLGTNAHSFPELVEQLGIMRFRPSAARSRHVLRLRPDPFRGCPAWLRRLRLGPQPGSVHAHLGCLQHRRRLEEER